MFNIIKNIWKDNVFSTIAGGLILIFITSAFSKYSTDNYLTIFSDYWYLILMISLIAVAILLFLKLNKKNKAASSYEIIPLRGWKELFEREYENVIWIIRTPNSDIWDLYLMNQSKPEDLFVKNIPLCPQCKTEITERKILFKKYLWLCINCGFRNKTKLSLDFACENIQRIIRGEFRKFRFDEENKKL